MTESEIALLAALQNKQQGGFFKEYTKFFIRDTFILCGEIHDDPRFTNGTLIHTSLVICMHEEENIAETRNTFYTLGNEVPHNKTSSDRTRLLSAL